MSAHIKRIAVRSFGALEDFELEPGGLTVVEGGNECGKSSLVDALYAWLRQTFRRSNALSLESMRDGLPGFEGLPEVELVDADDRDGGSLPDLLRENPILWNLLVIPEGSASLRKIGSGDRDWLDEAKPHLTGFDPEPIRRPLRARGGLTPSLRDTKDWKERGRRLEQRQHEVAELLASLDGLAAREAGLRTARRRLAEVDGEAALERRAVAFDRYRRADRALRIVSDNRDELERLERYTDQDLRRWRELDRRCQGERATVEATRRSLADCEDRATRATERLATLERDRDSAERAVASLRGSGLDGRAGAIRRAIDRAEERLRQAKRWRGAGLTLVAIGAIGVAAALGLGYPAVAAAVAVVGMIGLLPTLLEPGARKRRDAAERDAARVVASAEQIGLAVDSVGAVEAALHEWDRKAIVAQERALTARADAGRRIERRRDLARDFREVEDGLRETEREIAEIRERTGLAGIDDLESRVQKRRALSRDVGAAESTLEETFPDAKRADWPSRVESLRVDDPERAPRAGRLEELEAAREALRGEAGRLGDAVDGLLRDGLSRLGLADLDAAHLELRSADDELRQRELDRQAARLALDAVDDNERDVDAHLDRALSDPRQGAGPLFARLTGGRWIGIRRVEDGLEALDASGAGVTVDALSRGTRDQLHFALRATLAERILGRPSFFVWDDTFLTADPDRRRALVAAAVELVRRGWQILYLTVDPTIGELFEREARRRGDVELRRVRLPERDASGTAVASRPPDDAGEIEGVG